MWTKNPIKTFCSATSKVGAQSSYFYFQTILYQNVNKKIWKKNQFKLCFRPATSRAGTWSSWASPTPCLPWARFASCPPTPSPPSTCAGMEPWTRRLTSDAGCTTNRYNFFIFFTNRWIFSKLSLSNIMAILYLDV